MFLVEVDLANEFTAEQPQVVQMAAKRRAGELLCFDQMGNEGFELLKQAFTIAQIAFINFPAFRPAIHQSPCIAQVGVNFALARLQPSLVWT